MHEVEPCNCEKQRFLPSTESPPRQTGKRSWKSTWALEISLTLGSRGAQRLFQDELQDSLQAITVSMRALVAWHSLALRRAEDCCIIARALISSNICICDYGKDYCKDFLGYFLSAMICAWSSNRWVRLLGNESVALTCLTKTFLMIPSLLDWMCMFSEMRFQFFLIVGRRSFFIWKCQYRPRNNSDPLFLCSSR